MFHFEKEVVKLNHRYLLFAYDPHEAFGGIEDFLFGFNNYDDFAEKFEYKDLYIWQLVNTEDFSYKEFSTNIMYRVGKDDFLEISKKRSVEITNWINKNI